MAVHSICLLAILLFSAEAEVPQSNDASAMVDMMAQNDDAKLGEDVQAGTYDVLMDETEENSDDLDEDEITEDESSGLSDDEVPTSFAQQVDDESEADGEEEIADDIEEYGDMVDDEEAADVETTRDESEDASLLQADDADGVEMDADEDVLDAENGGEDKVDADASSESEDEGIGTGLTAPRPPGTMSPEEARLREKMNKKYREIGKMSPEEQEKLKQKMSADGYRRRAEEAKRDKERDAKDKEASTKRTRVYQNNGMGRWFEKIYVDENRSKVCPSDGEGNWSAPKAWTGTQARLGQLTCEQCRQSAERWGWDLKKCFRADLWSQKNITVGYTDDVSRPESCIAPDHDPCRVAVTPGPNTGPKHRGYHPYPIEFGRKQAGKEMFLKVEKLCECLQRLLGMCDTKDCLYAHLCKCPALCPGFKKSFGCPESSLLEINGASTKTNISESEPLVGALMARRAETTSKTANISVQMDMSVGGKCAPE